MVTALIRSLPFGEVKRCDVLIVAVRLTPLAIAERQATMPPSGQPNPFYIPSHPESDPYWMD